jgi:hypothetical protein
MLLQACDVIAVAKSTRYFGKAPWRGFHLGCGARSKRLVGREASRAAKENFLLDT